MKNTVSKLDCNGHSSLMIVVPAVLSFILLVTVGVLGLSSCASTPEGLQREQGVYLAVSNGLAGAQSIVPYIPAPANTAVEGLLGIGGALLALWASHLHRSINNLQNGNSTAASASQPPPPGGP